MESSLLQNATEQSQRVLKSDQQTGEAREMKCLSRGRALLQAKSHHFVAHGFTASRRLQLSPKDWQAGPELVVSKHLC